MPFKGSRGPVLIIAAIFVIVIIAIASLSSGGTAKKAGIAQVTVNAEVGVSSIIIINQNVVGGAITKAASDLPFVFNCNKGDTLQFYVNSINGYKFNAWWMDSTKTFNNGNPLTIKVNGDLTMTATVSIIPVQTQAPTE